MSILSSVDSVNELYVDDPDKASGGKIEVSLNISLPNLHCDCEYIIHQYIKSTSYFLSVVLYCCHDMLTLLPLFSIGIVYYKIRLCLPYCSYQISSLSYPCYPALSFSMACRSANDAPWC